jgi:tetratricopeptide (TPR) repeat protein
LGKIGPQSPDYAAALAAINGKARLCYACIVSACATPWRTTVLERATCLAACLATAMLLATAAPAVAEDTTACEAGGEAWRAGDIQGSIDDFTVCIEQGDLQPETMASALASRGNVLRVSGAVAHAISDFNRALEIDPDHPGALFGRANAWFDMRDLNQSMADFNHAIAAMPTMAEAYSGRGNVKSAEGDYLGAIADYDAALALRPSDSLTLTNRGWAKLSEGQYDAAIADFDAAIVIKPDYVLAYVNRAWTRYLQGDPAAGLPDAEHALVLGPNRVASHATYAQILTALGRKEDALAAFERAMALGGKEVVMNYQQRLAEQGYDAGPADGGYGARTRDALIACIEASCRLL